MARPGEPHFLRWLPPRTSFQRTGLQWLQHRHREQGRGRGPQVSSPQGGRSYVHGRGEYGPHDISFNQEIKLLSSFELSIHGCSPFIQL